MIQGPRGDVYLLPQSHCVRANETKGYNPEKPVPCALGPGVCGIPLPCPVFKDFIQQKLNMPPN